MTERFQVHLRGIIELLSAHLYSGPEVVVRELLQNGVDALTARQALGPLPANAGVRFAVLPQSDGPPLLRVSDDGVGLDEGEAALFLATIGQSSKRDDLAGARQEFLGQFGIGLLAGFLLADEIVVHTRSAKTKSAPLVEWIGRNDGTWSSRVVPPTERGVEQGVGTTVTLAARSDRRGFVEGGAVKDLVVRYGALLPFPVTVVDEEGRGERVLGDGAPWADALPAPATAQAAKTRATAAATTTKPTTTKPTTTTTTTTTTTPAAAKDPAKLAALASDVCGVRPLATVPLFSPTGQATGVAFLLSTAAPLARRRGDRVYLKGMLVGDDVEMLPDWAIFARAVVDARDLRPTASREALYVDETLEATRDELGACLRRFLIQTAKSDRPLLEELIALHHLGLKQMAAHDDELLELFGDWFPFETSAGAMTFGALSQRTTKLHYTPHLDEFRQMAPLASAHGLTLINAAYTFDVDVLRAVCALKSVELLRLDAAALAARLEDVDLRDHDKAAALADAAREALKGVDVDVEVKRFHPETLPAFYGAPDAVLRRRALEQSRDAALENNNPLAAALDEMLVSTTSELPTLAFNWRAPVVRRLAELAVRDEDPSSDTSFGGRALLLTALRVLYAQALLLGHHPLGAREMSALNTGLLTLVEAGVAAAVADSDSNLLQ